MCSTSQLLEFRVVKIDCDITEVTSGSQITLKICENLNVKKPADSSEQKALLEIVTNITTDDLPHFRLNVTSRAIFSLQEGTESFETIMQKECYPQAMPYVRKAIKEITSAMHITPLELAE